MRLPQNRGKPGTREEVKKGIQGNCHLQQALAGLFCTIFIQSILFAKCFFFVVFCYEMLEFGLEFSIKIIPSFHFTGKFSIATTEDGKLVC